MKEIHLFPYKWFQLLSKTQTCLVKSGFDIKLVLDYAPFFQLKWAFRSTHLEHIHPAYFYLHNNVMPLNNSNLFGDIVLVCEIRAACDIGVFRTEHEFI